LLAIAVLSILLAWGLGAALGASQLDAPWWLDTPAVLGFYGVLWKLYDRRGWKLRWRSLGVSDVPDVGGTWHGTVDSSYNGTSLNAVLAIRQTATHILIELETSHSRSTSVMATLNCSPGAFQGLSYVYENRPRTLSDPKMTPHSGRVYLRIGPDGNSLIGDYETDRHRGTNGRMNFVRS
jgi:hypothetical protein